ncbi:uncharacterized protein PITG_08410 [Phytophthora infestans T30-4]|uniref:Myb-like DNA-binding protein n=2 Tax=Phytophthora infestans TaxID=4787 RepID=D0NAJ1_PHYIT|nr:uncharacterized protein PITG_08410 [Phytophthora infestans T30-4]EEY54849.1 conserved hypothetical protein [Phytophthora infestans T30-4]|eukprot:XP_002903794.1 conserved hypothetical protein [Phytophthora infestans T30-4]
MDTLLPPTPDKETVLQRYERPPRIRKKMGVVPRSYIRQQASFFTDEEEHERKVGRPKKKKQKTVELTGGEDEEQAKLRALSEPPPNADTEFLRARSHEAFIAGPPTIFSPKERKVVKEFAEDFYMTHAPNEEIPLQMWNNIHVWQGTRKSRQLPIERSGFACKLWYDLHESPSLRLCAWSKAEDAALRRLATGEVDSTLVNQWHEIAKRMPIPGRPAAHCLTRYQTALCANNAKSGFTPEEDQILREAVPIFGEKWNVIADLLDGRVSEQIRHRWQLTLAPGLRRGKFSVIEDRRMLLALRAYVPKGCEYNLEQVAWSDISHHIPGRTQPAIRDRFLNCLNPDLSFRKFTKQEDQIILSKVQEWGIESARLWPRLAAELGDRTDAQVCRRWRLLDPEAYEKRSEALEKATARQTTSVFRRRSIHRRVPNNNSRHTSRSSYNGEVEQAEQNKATRRGPRGPAK